jgi:Zn-dependent protease with chaperone function
MTSSEPGSVFDVPPIDAEEICARVRFQLDEPVALPEPARTHYREALAAIRTEARTTMMRVGARSMPGIHRAVEHAAERLQLTSLPEVYLKANPTVNAMVANGPDGTSPVVVLHSGLVDLLEMEELASVIGHEFGHALLRHHRPFGSMAMDDTRIALTLENIRSGEISADRVGLIAAGSLEHALRAELKILGGVQRHQLPTDIEPFITEAQAALDAHRACEHRVEGTHPESAFRIWALARFAQSEAFAPAIGPRGRRPHDEVEAEIVDEFLALAGGNALWRTADATHEALAWLGVLLVHLDGEITDPERVELSRLVGVIWAEDAVAYTKRHGLDAVRRRARESLETLRHAAPRSRRRLITWVREFAERTGNRARQDEVVGMVDAVIRG